MGLYRLSLTETSSSMNDCHNQRPPLNIHALNQPDRENTKVPCGQASQAALPFLPALWATVLEDEPLSRMNLARSCRGGILQRPYIHYTSIYRPCIVLYKGIFGYVCMFIPRVPTMASSCMNVSNTCEINVEPMHECQQHLQNKG